MSSRRIVGWVLRNDLKNRLVLDALEMALAQRRPNGVIHYEDEQVERALAVGPGSAGMGSRTAPMSGVGLSSRHNLGRYFPADEGEVSIPS